MNKTDIINIIKEELADVLREAKHVPPGTTDNPPPPPPDTGPHLNEASSFMDSIEIKDFYKAVDALEMIYNKLVAGKDLDSRDQKKLKKDMLHYINKQL